ncbi:MAG: class A beta-lactamase-related serine hydrolase [Sphingobacteriales bacterium]|nr:MAG: class A beta-lactamase-related serine hydrolase [Sphingobacteriales bacterium]
MRFYITSIILSIFFVACQPHTEEVQAGPRFYDQPNRVITNAIVYADTNSAENRRIIQRLDSFYRVQVRSGFNGSVLIGQGGKVVYERYFGMARKEKNLPLGPNVSSQLASTSKTFTGTAILYLHQHNYLNINDPVKNYLPTFPYPAITVRMLLTHRSGLPDYQKWSKPVIANDKTPITNDQVLHIFATRKPAVESRPDTRFKYCNSNYALLASIIEKVTEMKYKDFMREYIFEPLGMNNTFVFDHTAGLPPNTTNTYRYNWSVWPNSFADGVDGDKGIYSTVQDMYRWDQSFYKNTLLNQETQNEAYQPYSNEKPGVKNYGLGWRMLAFPNGNKIIYHNGWWHGNNTAFYRFIREDITFIVLGNKYNEGIYRQPKMLYSILKNVPVNEGFEGES